jgi:hypothetical protein
MSTKRRLLSIFCHHIALNRIQPDGVGNRPDKKLHIIDSSMFTFTEQFARVLIPGAAGRGDDFCWDAGSGTLILCGIVFKVS